MVQNKKFKNLRGYIILLISFIALMLLKEFEVFIIKKAMGQVKPELLKLN
tara:strand:+ start:426 stop:575 length:150 start_codon:yes stop_codon:yes gene_type:complete